MSCMQTHSAWAIVDFPLQLDYPNGFSARAYHLLKAVGSHLPLDIIGLHSDGADWNQDTFLPPNFPVCHTWYEALPRHPLYASGVRGRLRRIKHYAFDEHSSAAYPRQFPNVHVHYDQHMPQLAIFFLPHLAHLSSELPLSVPCIYVLEEGLERSFAWVGPDMPRWKRKWIDGVEQVAAQRLYHRLAARKAHVIAISAEEKNYFSKYMPSENIHVIPHAIDCTYFRPGEGPIDQHTDIAIFGVLGHKRTYEPALELYTHMKATDTSHCSWAFVGKDPSPSLQALESQNVTITGLVPDIRPYYDRSKVVVVPSQKGGGVKTTVLQAWAMGRPVVATPFALTGLPSRPGENVLVGNTVEELSYHISTLLGSAPLRDQIGRAGRETVCLERNIDVVAKQFTDLCLTVMASASKNSN